MHVRTTFSGGAVHIWCSCDYIHQLGSTCVKQPQLRHTVGVYVASSAALWLTDTMELCGAVEYEISDVVRVGRADESMFGFHVDPDCHITASFQRRNKSSLHREKISPVSSSLTDPCHCWFVRGRISVGGREMRGKLQCGGALQPVTENCWSDTESLHNITHRHKKQQHVKTDCNLNSA